MCHWALKFYIANIQKNVKNKKYFLYKYQQK